MCPFIHCYNSSASKLLRIEIILFISLAVVLGPVGLLVGAASVGIGMGFMQIPEEQRTKLGASATTSFEKARNITCELSDTMSTACAKYSGTNVSEVAEVVGKVVPDELINTCRGACGGSSNGDGDETDKSNRYQSGGEDGQSLTSAKSGGLDIRAIDSSPIANVERGMNRLVGDVFGDEQNSPMVSQLVGGVGGPGENNDMTNEDGDTPVGRRVACGRKGMWQLLTLLDSKSLMHVHASQARTSYYSSLYN